MTVKRLYSSLILLVFIISLFGPANAAEKTDNQTLVVGEIWDIEGLDPASGHSVTVNDKALIVETLVGTDQDFKLKPLLATSWKQLDDNTWEFNLREGVTFSDGSKMTADDVKFSIERAEKLDATVKSLLKLDSVEVVDPKTIRIHTKSPNSIIPGILHYASISIISPKSVDDKGDFKEPIGTGPFKLESFDAKTHVLTVTKNDNWWGGKAKLNKIVLKPIEDPNTRAMALESGDVDFTVDVPYSEADRIDALDGISVEKYATPRVYRIEINLKRAPLDDVRVRQAISYSIDRDQIAKYVLFNVGSPAIGPFIPSMFWANQNLKSYDYNLDTAKKLLDDAGWMDSNGDGIRDKDGKPLELSLLTYVERPGLPPMAEAIAGQLKDAGIKINVETMENGASSDRQKKGEWDLYLSATNTGMVPDPLYYLSLSYGTDGSNNKPGYSNPKVDSIISEAYKTVDEKERIEMLDNLESIVQEDLPIINVAYYGVAIAKKDYVKGYVFDPTAHDYRISPDMYIEE
jgi:peptide/nickel transport system substrate-binding protein